MTRHAEALLRPPGIPERAFEVASSVREKARALEHQFAWPVKATLATDLFFWHLSAFEETTDPLPAFEAIMHAASQVLDDCRRMLDRGDFPRPQAAEGEKGQDVGELYGEAWLQLSDENYFEETPERLKERLARNQIDPGALFADKSVLDAGCGCGNYTLAIAQLGARDVIGIDIGVAGLEFARRKAAEVGAETQIEYRAGSADEIPLDDACVDFVWSNSVVHVTGNYEAAIAETARVLRPGGTLFLYVDGRMGLFELLMNTLRALLDGVPPDLTRNLLIRLGIDSGRITWMMANFYVFYERRSREDVEALLRANGFGDLRQLTRGLAIDPIEGVSGGAPFAALKYGEGPLKYLATKA